MRSKYLVVAAVLAALLVAPPTPAAEISNAVVIGGVQFKVSLEHHEVRDIDKIASILSRVKRLAPDQIEMVLEVLKSEGDRLSAKDQGQGVVATVVVFVKNPQKRALERVPVIGRIISKKKGKVEYEALLQKVEPR